MITNMTAAQKIAATSDAECVLVAAGPGSGKTATLVERMKFLQSFGADLNRMAVLTFTNAAADELRRRFTETPDGAAVDNPVEPGFLGTLHAFALRMLRELGSNWGYGGRISIVSPESAQDLLLSKAKSLGCKSSIEELLALKAQGRPAPGERLDIAKVVVTGYLDDMRAAGVVDYDALLNEFDRLLDEEAFTYEIAKLFDCLFVDEVQDSAPVDWRIYHGLPMRMKFYVGDTDQAIYSFRGGRVEGMLAQSFDARTLNVLLQENFRSTSEICEAAQRLIEHNKNRIDKKTISAVGPGGVVCVIPPVVSESAEIETVAALVRDSFETRSIAILARTNFIADGFRRSLPRHGVPVIDVKRTALPRDWRLARAFVELAVNPENDALAFFFLVQLYALRGGNAADARGAAHAVRNAAAAAGKTINRANLGFAPVTRPESVVEAMKAQPISRESRAIVADMLRKLPRGSTALDLALALGEVREFVIEEEVGGKGVHVLTMHGAKGREFDVVVLAGFEEEALPGRAARLGPEAIEEERRLAYVAATRARYNLFITSASSRKSAWQSIDARTPSRFISELVGREIAAAPPNVLDHVSP
jgi:superfamily I DNA/RNA helicase